MRLRTLACLVVLVTLPQAAWCGDDFPLTVGKFTSLFPRQRVSYAKASVDYYRHGQKPSVKHDGNGALVSLWYLFDKGRVYAFPNNQLSLASDKTSVLFLESSTADDCGPVVGTVDTNGFVTFTPPYTEVVDWPFVYWSQSHGVFYELREHPLFSTQVYRDMAAGKFLEGGFRDGKWGRVHSFGDFARYSRDKNGAVETFVHDAQGREPADYLETMVAQESSSLADFPLVSDEGIPLQGAVLARVELNRQNLLTVTAESEQRLVGHYREDGKIEHGIRPVRHGTNDSLALGLTKPLGDFPLYKEACVAAQKSKHLTYYGLVSKR